MGPQSYSSLPTTTHRRRVALWKGLCSLLSCPCASSAHFRPPFLLRFAFTLLCHSPFTLLFFSFRKGDSEAVVVSALRVLAGASAGVREAAPGLQKSFRPVLFDLCVNGSRRQAKLAVQALQALSGAGGVAGVGGSAGEGRAGAGGRKSTPTDGPLSAVRFGGGGSYLPAPSCAHMAFRSVPLRNAFVFAFAARCCCGVLLNPATSELPRPDRICLPLSVHLPLPFPMMCLARSIR